MYLLGVAELCAHKIDSRIISYYFCIYDVVIVRGGRKEKVKRGGTRFKQIAPIKVL